MFGRDQEITELAASMSPESLRPELNAIVDEITDDDGLDRAARQQPETTVSMKIDDDTGMHTLYARPTPKPAAASDGSLHSTSEPDRRSDCRNARSAA